jgi:hypothetical protein
MLPAAELSVISPALSVICVNAKEHGRSTALALAGAHFVFPSVRVPVAPGLRITSKDFLTIDEAYHKNGHNYSCFVFYWVKYRTKTI